jgi:pimeloyl-ACP methyl ester carboxylesterase
MDVLPAEVVLADGAVLRGERWCGDDIWLVLAHDRSRDLDDWRPLQPFVAERGRSALALDLRGHGGSDGDGWDPEADLLAALGYVREQGGVAVSVIAAGETALAALRVPADVLVLLSPHPCSDREHPSASEIPRMFLYGSRDPAIDRTVASLRASARAWAGSVAFPTAEQGVELLAGTWATQTLSQIGSFLDEQLYVAAP